MLPGSGARSLLAVALGLVPSMVIALSAAAAPASVPVPAATSATFLDLPLLHTVMAVLDSRSLRVPDAVTGWYVDRPSNAVVVTATDDAAARVFTAGLPKVRVEHVDSRPVLMEALRGGDQISSQSGRNCSIGFTAIKGNVRYVITAGHCTRDGGTFYSRGRPIGPVVASSYPDDDFGVIKVTEPPWRLSGDVGSSSSGYLSVKGSTPAQVGQIVCRFGFVSGWRCGHVEAIGVTMNYGNGEVVHGLTRTSACAEGGGDSGGPFMSDKQAQGMLSGADAENTCRSGGKTYFQPVQEVLDTYGLSLLAGGFDFEF